MLAFVDLFCGGGFGARGAKKGGGNPLLAVDAWDQATSTYAANFPQARIITDKIENIDPLDYIENFSPDVLLTSPECTSHSIARGAKPGCERSRETAISIFPWIEAFEPRWVIVENVSRMKNWARHDELLHTLEDKYQYTVSQLALNAADFGTPQSRRRLFLICDRFGTRTEEEDLRVLHKKQPKTASSILDKPGTHKSKPLNSPGRATATLERAGRAIAELGEGVPFLIVYYGSDYAGGWQSLDVPLRTVTTLDRFGLVTWESGVPMLRMLQPTELLRAMGAGTHKLPTGSRRDKVKLCGNGVCSPVMEVIFRRLNRLSEEGLDYSEAV